ncbi:hypothetical protein AB0L10_29145 [Streptomyces flaveolus]|uniref:hypothetical protein n=1 Tax=Streptomyces flaveolus TaxID=67297 RepID=UPI0034191783
MSGEIKIVGAQPPDDPDVFGIRRPTSAQVSMYGLALLGAANTAQAHHTGAAVGVVIVATGAFLKGCIRRRR